MAAGNAARRLVAASLVCSSLVSLSAPAFAQHLIRSGERQANGQPAAATQGQPVHNSPAQTALERHRQEEATRSAQASPDAEVPKASPRPSVEGEILDTGRSGAYAEYSRNLDQRTVSDAVGQQTRTTLPVRRLEGVSTMPIAGTTATKAPPSLEALKTPPRAPKDGKLAAQLLSREGSLKNAAISFGMRGGLAWRSHEINLNLDKLSSKLDAVWAFNRIVVPLDSGNAIMVPPVVSEGNGPAVRMGEDNTSASIVSHEIRIVEHAYISGVAPHWRTYLLRSWDAPELPDSLLLPKDDEEAKAWARWVEEGWHLGIKQANMIFEIDASRLSRDFHGMVRYRELVAADMIRDVFVARSDMGITGGGNTLRIGDRLVQITRPASLETDPSRWQAYTLTTGMAGLPPLETPAQQK